jgi:glycosyltransferase involved in cell wall biosynthesis
MRRDIGIKNAFVLPNGVNFNRFYPIPQMEAIKKLNFNPQKKHILFAANPSRQEKNYNLTKEAIKLLQNNDLEVHFLENISNEDTIWYYCASDVVILSSTREGSPNVIKEAMACNRPIVATDVGDIKEIFGGIEGCYISDFEATDLAEKIKSALLFKGQTKGREQIEYLRSELIAKKLYGIYGQSK